MLPRGATDFNEYGRLFSIAFNKVISKLDTYEEDITLFPSNIRTNIRNGMKNAVDDFITELNAVKTHIDTLT